MGSGSLGAGLGCAVPVPGLRFGVPGGLCSSPGCPVRGRSGQDLVSVAVCLGETQLKNGVLGMSTEERGARGSAAESEVAGVCTASALSLLTAWMMAKWSLSPKPAPKIHTPNPLGVGLEPGSPLVPLRARASLFPSHPQPGSANPQSPAGTGWWRLDPKSSRLVVTRRVTSAWAPERRFGVLAGGPVRDGELPPARCLRAPCAGRGGSLAILLLRSRLIASGFVNAKITSSLALAGGVEQQTYSIFKKAALQSWERLGK